MEMLDIGISMDNIEVKWRGWVAGVQREIGRGKEGRHN